MVAISAVIITYNEEANIGRCIDSLVGVVDEILIVDSFSADRTEAICRQKGVRFIQHAFEGYIEQKNYALDQARNEHVLSLDADEALSPALADSVRKVREEWTCDAYAMNRLTNYCGKWVRHSGWYPDRKIRLFLRTKGRWGGTNPHDRFILSSGATSGRLKGDLLHYSYHTMDDHLRQIDRFSAIGAKALYEKGVRSSAFKAFYKSIARFLRHYIVQAGFLDGAAGWHIAYNSAKAVRLKYQRLSRLWKGLPI